MNQLFDITAKVKLTRADGSALTGTITARVPIDLASHPWPDQGWSDGSDVGAYDPETLEAIEVISTSLAKP